MPRVGVDTTRQADFERSFAQLRDYARRSYNSVWSMPAEWGTIGGGAANSELLLTPGGLVAWELRTAGGGDEIHTSFFVRDHWARGGPLSILIAYNSAGVTAEFTITFTELDIGALDASATTQVLVVSQAGLTPGRLNVFQDKDTFVLDGNEGVFTLGFLNTNSNDLQFYGSIMGYLETEQR